MHMTQKQDTRFNFSEVEPRIYQKWQESGCFKTSVDSDGKVRDKKRAQAPSYTIAIPPPNVTGRLHMGHALNNTIQDMLIRYKRMDGLDALWVPGTDHAGIATQTVVKKMLDEHGIDYRKLGREKFIQKVWEWKEKYGDMILNQLRKIGCSCDWDRTRFTMDEGLSRAVTHTFKTLYDEGLIYRGKRIVNWCPVDKTALSDDEVETKEGGEPGFLWHIKYPLEDGSANMIVATTRPETLFGDVAVAVNPKDERYTKLIGKHVVLPLQRRVIPIIADEYVDMEFGTGCLKITPAHDPNDFEIGQRHGLAPINVMNDDATMNDVVPESYRGMDRFKCRDKAVMELQEQELLVSVEERMTPLGRSYRSKAVIEYRLSDQWFVKMKPLAEKALAKHKELNITPSRWDKVYLTWLHNIRDWCISRQIWWGHRIPAWYCQGSEAKSGACPPIVSETVPQKCPHCGSAHLEQENDVLDTWFSSALWPMSTLGWPEKTPDFKRYFPTTTLVTGKDIIFFWVARMNVMAIHFTGHMPYKNVFINPIVLDERGETMSKSKGNGIDPLVIVDGANLEELEGPVREARPSNMKEILNRLEKRFPNGFEGVGADALRYTMIYLCSSGQQMKVSLDGFQDLGRRFMTKLWNAARFVMMALEQEENRGETQIPPTLFKPYLTDADKWMDAKCQLTSGKIRQMYDDHEFTHLGQTYYQFFWNDYCDWYIETCKERFTSPDCLTRQIALHCLAVFFTRALRLMHPMIPFITEELWGRICPIVTRLKLWGRSAPTSALLIHEEFPKCVEMDEEQKRILSQFERLQDFVTAIRTMRKFYNIKDGDKLQVSCLAHDASTKGFIQQSQAMICRLANLSDLVVVGHKNQKPKKSVTIVDPAFEIYLEIAEYIDAEAEKKRLNGEIEKLEKLIMSLNKRLQNQDFVNNAKPDVVEEQRGSLNGHKERLEKLHGLLKEMSQW